MWAFVFFNNLTPQQSTTTKKSVLTQTDPSDCFNNPSETDLSLRIRSFLFSRRVLHERVSPLESDRYASSGLLTQLYP